MEPTTNHPAAATSDQFTAPSIRGPASCTVGHALAAIQPLPARSVRATPDSAAGALAVPPPAPNASKTLIVEQAAHAPARASPQDAQARAMPLPAPWRAHPASWLRIVAWSPLRAQDLLQGLVQGCAGVHR